MQAILTLLLVFTAYVLPGCIYKRGFFWFYKMLLSTILSQRSSKVVLKEILHKEA